MDKMTYECSLDLAQDVIFGDCGKVSDALVLLNWLDSHKAAMPSKEVVGFHTVYYCRHCNFPVNKGDNFCSKCGRGQLW